MSDILKENQLLKGYISSLEKQNEARNIERNTLFHEIDRMGAEIDRLNNIISKHNSKNSNNSNQIERQLKSLKESNANLLKEMQIIKSKNSQFSSQIKTKQSSISMLTQQKQSLFSQIMILKESELQLSLSKNKIINLQSQINNYRSKMNSTFIYQEKNSTLNIKICQLQERFEELDNKYKKEIYLYQGQIQSLQIENEQLKLNNKASVEISNLLNSKINLEATIKRLNGKIQWLQSNNTNHAEQKRSLQAKIRDLQAGLLQTNKYIQELKNNQLSFQNLEASRNAKDKEITTLQNMIESLKGNKKYLEKSLREKQEIISHLQSEIYNITNLKQKDHEVETQNHELKTIRIQLQQKINILAQNNHNLQGQMNKIIQKEKTYISEINSLRQQRERLLKELDNQNYSLDQAQNQLKLYKSKVTEYTINRNESNFRNVPQRDHHHRNDNQNFRLIVSKLQQQIEQLKASQFKSQLFQQNIYNNYQSLSNINIQSQMSRQSRSPKAVVLVNSPTDKNEYNKRKWQNLQRKIHVLRNQNETLKKTLFD